MATLSGLFPFEGLPVEKRKNTNAVASKLEAFMFQEKLKHVPC